MRSFHLQRTPRPPQDGILVVEHEFEGGPFAGRRMTGFASTFEMYVERSARGRRARLVARGGARECIGSYRFQRKYDCTSTGERVHVYQWCPRDGQRYPAPEMHRSDTSRGSHRSSG